MSFHTLRIGRAPIAAQALFASLALAVLGCASTPAADRGWIEISSKNFSVFTSMKQPDARELLENLELFRAALLKVTKLRDTRPRIPTEIYAFEQSSDYDQFRPARYAAGHFTSTLRGNLVVLSTGKDSLSARVIVYHEYTHFLVHNEARGRYPRWFDEGFAELLSSVDVLGTMVRIGAVPPYSASWLRYGTKLPYARVIRAPDFEGWSDKEVGAYYAQAWLLVHYLVLGQHFDDFPERLERYRQRADRTGDDEQAFSEAFGIDVHELADRLKQYATQIPTFGLPRSGLAPESVTTARDVPSDEIAERLGWLAFSGRKIPVAQAYFARASEANPKNARAIAGIAEIDKLNGRWREAEVSYQRAVELAPDDWQNQLEIAEYFAYRAQRDEADRDANLAHAREHLSRAIELAPTIPEGHAALGATYTIGDQPPEPRIAPLEHALELLPSNPSIEYPLAQLYSRAGRRAQAIELLRPLVRQLHGEPSAEAQKLLAQLEDADGGGERATHGEDR